MKHNLINTVGKDNLNNVYYNTACLRVTEGNDYRKVHIELITFAEKTNSERGCIEFFVAPSSIDNKEFMLWEIWQDASFLTKHMQAEHTTAILSKNLVSVLWSNAVDMKA